MGLDITAYYGLSNVENPALDSDGYPVADNQWKATSVDFTERNFPGRTAGIENGAVYEYKDSFGFRAGSYGGYNEWRNDLAKLAGYGGADDCWNNHTSGPFYELINFYDNEGTIGPVIAAKLAKDFSEHHEMAAIVGGFFFKSYCDWQKAFKMAADNGAVDFH